MLDDFAISRTVSAYGSEIVSTCAYGQSTSPEKKLTNDESASTHSKLHRITEDIRAKYPFLGAPSHQTLIAELRRRDLLELFRSALHP